MAFVDRIIGHAIAYYSRYRTYLSLAASALSEMYDKNQINRRIMDREGLLPPGDGLDDLAEERYHSHNAARYIVIYDAR